MPKFCLPGFEEVGCELLMTLGGLAAENAGRPGPTAKALHEWEQLINAAMAERRAAASACVVPFASAQVAAGDACFAFAADGGVS